VTLKNSVSRATDMNVFGSSQSSETNTFLVNLEQIVKSYLNKLDKFENSVKEQREQIVTFQSLQIDYMKRIDDQCFTDVQY